MPNQPSRNYAYKGSNGVELHATKFALCKLLVELWAIAAQRLPAGRGLNARVQVQNVSLADAWHRRV